MNLAKNSFFALTWFAFILSFSFVLIGIWNNDDWQLVEKGFYTTTLGWITFSAISLVKTLYDINEGVKTSPVYVFFAWLSAIISISIAVIAVYNTEWVLVEKGYYWLGIAFISYTSFALMKEMRERENAKANAPVEELE